MRFSIQVCLILCMLLGSTSLYGVTWFGGADENWYNPANYGTPTGSEVLPPDANTPVSLAIAVNTPPTRRNCNINGGTATSKSISMWAGVANDTAKFTVTGGAVLTINGNLELASADANAGAEVDINDGSKVSVAQIFVGRSVNGNKGLATLDISGIGTEVVASTSVFIGYPADMNNTFPGPGRVVVRDGALLKGNGAGSSFAINVAGTNDAVLDIAGGEVQIKGDRVFQVPVWIQKGWLIGYGGTGNLSYYYNSTTGYTCIKGELIPEIPASATIVTGFRDDFEGANDPDYYWDGDPISICKPPVGYQWTVTGTGGSLHKIDATTFAPNKVFLVSRSTTSGATLSWARPRPLFMRSPGFVYRFEHDLYIPSGPGEFTFDLRTWSSSDLFYYYGIEGRNWYATRTLNNTRYDLGVAMPVDQWVHMRTDMNYDQRSYSVWYKLADGIERNLVANAPFTSPTTTYDVRAELEAGPPAAPCTLSRAFVDNMEIKLIDKTPQGYPTIAPASDPITIDGTIDFTNEWADAKRVASKPAGSKGNFNPVMPSSYDKGLASTTVVDTYVTYDKSNFYIAIKGNNMTSAPQGTTERGRVEAVFTWDYNDVSPTVSKAFVISAIGPNADPNACSVQESLSYASLTVTDFNSFKLAGGQMGYKLNGNNIEAEMKIPFTSLPDFTGIQPGVKVNLVFNYVETATGDHRAGTSPNGEFVPGVPLHERGLPLVAGIKFPQLGDLNADGCVSYADLSILTLNWLAVDSIYEQSGNNVLNLNDFATIVSNWNQCNP